MSGTAQKPQPLPYYGGKQGYGKSSWIAGLLPWRKDTIYVEPFCGMAAVLCARRPVSVEILNDKNERLVNWWRAVRDHPEEFGHLVECTPHSQADYDWAVANMDNMELSVPMRALAFHVVVWLNVVHGDGHLSAGMGVCYSWQRGTTGRWRNERVATLAERLWDVQLLCGDGLEILDRVKDNPDAVIYVDPPYPGSDVSPYLHRKVDIDALGDVLAAQKGFVAISGYGNDWDGMDWQRHEMSTIVRRPGVNAPAGSAKRSEILWTNYDTNRYGTNGTLKLL